VTGGRWRRIEPSVRSAVPERAEGGGGGGAAAGGGSQRDRIRKRINDTGALPWAAAHPAPCASGGGGPSHISVLLRRRDRDARVGHRHDCNAREPPCLRDGRISQHHRAARRRRRGRRCGRRCGRRRRRRRRRRRLSSREEHLLVRAEVEATRARGGAQLLECLGLDLVRVRVRVRVRVGLGLELGWLGLGLGLGLVRGVVRLRARARVRARVTVAAISSPSSSFARRWWSRRHANMTGR
jgi:hypothetical protein